MNGRHRNATNGQIWEMKNDSNYDGNCTARHCLSGTYEISRRWIFVGLSVHIQHYNCQIITVNNNQCHSEKSFPRSQQLLSYSFNSLSFTEHYYFHHSPTHTPSPNFFSPSTFCSHIYSSQNNTAILRPIHLVQFKHHVDMTI